MGFDPVVSVDVWQICVAECGFIGLHFFRQNLKEGFSTVILCSFGCLSIVCLCVCVREWVFFIARDRKHTFLLISQENKNTEQWWHVRQRQRWCGRRRWQWRQFSRKLNNLWNRRKFLLSHYFRFFVVLVMENKRGLCACMCVWERKWECMCVRLSMVWHAVVMCTSGPCMWV